MQMARAVMSLRTCGEPVQSVDEIHGVDDRHRQRQRHQDRRHLVEDNGSNPTEGL